MGVAIALAAGSVMAGAAMQGMAASRQAKNQRAANAFQDFQERMAVDAQNRAIARQNAEKWMANRHLAEAANKTRAEEEFFLRYNFNNETGMFSRNTKRTHDSMVSHLTGRNIRGQTANQLLGQGLTGAKEMLVNQRVQFGNRMRGIERKQQATLAQRDFGYQDYIEIGEKLDTTPDPNDVLMTALAQGAVKATFAGIGAYQQQGLVNEQQQFQQEQLDYQRAQTAFQMHRAMGGGWFPVGGR